MSKDRDELAEIIKEWAQSHNTEYLINDPAPGDQGVTNTGTYFTWLLHEGTDINLLSLLNKLEAHYLSKNKIKSDGMSCSKCKAFYHFAEPNQPDGTLICYPCRNP